MSRFIIVLFSRPILGISDHKSLFCEDLQFYSSSNMMITTIVLSITRAVTCPNIRYDKMASAATATTPDSWT